MTSIGTSTSSGDAPENSFGQLPNGWIRLPLGDLCRLQGGFAFKSSDYVESGAPLIRIGDITGEKITIGSNTAHLPSNYIEAHPNFVLSDGDLLMAMTGHPGKSGVYRSSKPALLNQRVGRFLIQDPSALDLKFLRYLLLYLQPTIADAAYGGSQPNISAKDVAKIRVSVPPIEAQHRIVARIDELFTELDDGETALERARDDLESYRKSLLKAAVTGELTANWRAANPPQEAGEQLLQRILADRKARWEADPKNKGKLYKEPSQPDLETVPPLPTDWTWCSLEQLSSPLPHSISDGPFGSNLKSEHYRDEGPRVVRLQNIGKRGEFVDAKAHIAVDHFDTLERHHVRPGDLVVAILGEPLPKAMIVPDDFGEGLVKADCIKVRLADDCLTPFVWSVLNSPIAHSLMSHRVKGVGRPRIGMAQIKSMPIPLPPLTEITEIAETLAAGLKQAADGEGKISDYLLLSECARRSILSTAFKGELDQ